VKKNWVVIPRVNFQRIIELFTQKTVTKISKIWVWDPGSEIWDPEKIYSGSRIQGSKRHWIPDPDLQHWTIFLILASRLGIYKSVFRIHMFLGLPDPDPL
jgi:hypothetical protein